MPARPFLNLRSARRARGRGPPFGAGDGAALLATDDDLFDDAQPEDTGAAADEDAEFQNGMVAVYARPRTTMERELDVPCSMRIDDDATNSICVIDPADGQERSWVVDALFNGAAGDKGVGPSHAANQETLWEELGETLLYWAGSGQSVALVAVGERAVGKSHCLFGARGEQAGLVPRFSRRAGGARARTCRRRPAPRSPRCARRHHRPAAADVAAARVRRGPPLRFGRAPGLRRRRTRTRRTTRPRRPSSSTRCSTSPP